MSKVKEFVVYEPGAGMRSPSYQVNASATPKERAHWPAGNPLHMPGFSQVPVAPQLVGQSYPIQIRTVLTNYYRYIGQVPSRASLDRQVKQLTVHYRDLRGLGFDIQDVTTFGLRHAKALLAKWRMNQCAPTTIYPRWSVLRSWSRALGKHGMLGTLTELLPGFSRRPEPGSTYRTLTLDQLRDRSAFLESKSDLTVYFVDRLCREFGMTREDALQIELVNVKAVVEGGATVLRVGMGNSRQNFPNAQLNLPLFTQICNFMVSRNRGTLAWSNLDLDASLQKYTLRLSYVTRTLFPEIKRRTKAVTQERSAA